MTEPYSQEITRKYNLYLNETAKRALYWGDNLLNKKTDLILICRNQNNFLSRDSK